jgi:hypothetical protein
MYRQDAYGGRHAESYGKDTRAHAGRDIQVTAFFNDMTRGIPLAKF